jgi:hypothetical protein
MQNINFSGSVDLAALHLDLKVQSVGGNRLSGVLDVSALLPAPEELRIYISNVSDSVGLAALPNDLKATTG